MASKQLFIIILTIFISSQSVLGLFTDPQAFFRVFFDSGSTSNNDQVMPHINKVCIADTPSVRSANQAHSIRNEILVALNRLPEVSTVFTGLIAKAADAISELMSDGNSTLLLDVTGKTGRMFTETTASFAKLLNTTDEFLDHIIRSHDSATINASSVNNTNGTIKTNHNQAYHSYPAYDAELIASKLRLVETTRLTLGEFLSELSRLADISFENNNKTKDIIHAEELLIDKTKESYQIIYDTTNRILRQVLDTQFVSKPVKKIIASRILRSASNNIIAFAKLRKNISHALADAALNKGLNEASVNEFQKHMQNQFLANAWEDGIEKDADTKLPLTVEQKKELEGLMVNYTKEFV